MSLNPLFLESCNDQSFKEQNSGCFLTKMGNLFGKSKTTHRILFQGESISITVWFMRIKIWKLATTITVENIIFLNNTIRDKISFKIIISYLYLTDSLR